MVPLKETCSFPVVEVDALPEPAVMVRMQAEALHRTAPNILSDQGTSVARILCEQRMICS